MLERPWKFAVSLYRKSRMKKDLERRTRPSFSRATTLRGVFIASGSTAA